MSAGGVAVGGYRRVARLALVTWALPFVFVHLLLAYSYYAYVIRLINDVIDSVYLQVRRRTKRCAIPVSSLSLSLLVRMSIAAFGTRERRERERERVVVEREER